jgi:hypothetical protein
MVSCTNRTGRRIWAFEIENSYKIVPMSTAELLKTVLSHAIMEMPRSIPEDMKPAMFRRKFEGSKKFIGLFKR